MNKSEAFFNTSTCLIFRFVSFGTFGSFTKLVLVPEVRTFKIVIIIHVHVVCLEIKF